MSEKIIRLPEIVGGGYGDFWRCRSRYRVLKGGKASKKSSTTALNFIVRLMRSPQANLLVVRQVMETHRTSTFAQLRWAIHRLGLDDEWKSTLSPLELCRPATGQKIIFRGFDDVYKLASITVEHGALCWVWVEEAFEMASESAFDLFDLSVPRGAVPEGLYKQTTLTFNPWNERHWLKKRFFDTPDPDVRTFTTNYLCNEFLDDTDRRRYERMKRDNPRKYAVAGLGEWGVTDGLVFTDWEVREFSPDTLSGDYRRVFGLDYGYANDPTAFIAAAVSGKERRAYIFDEHYGAHMLNSDIVRMIRDKGFSKERIRADSAEPKSNEELRRAGISRIMPARKGPDSVRAGIAAMQEYHLIVHPCCRNTVAELSSYVWDTKDDGSGINKPVDRDNHLMDALRYAFADVTVFNAAPSERARYAVAAGISAADMTGAWT